MVENARRRARGFSLVELAVALTVAAILFLGVYVVAAQVVGRSTRAALRYGIVAGNMQTALHGIGYIIRQGVNNGARKFVVYTSRTSLTAVADGQSGTCLKVPYPNAADDVLIYAEDGALVVEKIASGAEQKLVAKYVDSVTATADMSGSPATRSGVVRFAISTTYQGESAVLNCAEFPRNK